MHNVSAPFRPRETYKMSNLHTSQVLNELSRLLQDNLLDVGERRSQTNNYFMNGALAPEYYKNKKQGDF
jgi:hypothetical protein